MMILDENGKLIFNKLQISNTLSSSNMIKKYIFNRMRKEFHHLLDLIQENYDYNICYQEFIKFNIDEKLNFIVIEDPNYKNIDYR